MLAHGPPGLEPPCLSPSRSHHGCCSDSSRCTSSSRCSIDARTAKCHHDLAADGITLSSGSHIASTTRIKLNGRNKTPSVPSPAPLSISTSCNQSCANTSSYPNSSHVLPSRGSHKNLEEMIGSSLALAINNLDQLAHPSESPSGTSLTGSTSPSSASAGTNSPADYSPSTPPDLLTDPSAYHLHQLQQQRSGQNLHLSSYPPPSPTQLSCSPRAMSHGMPPLRMTIPGNMTNTTPHYLSTTLSTDTSLPTRAPHQARLPVPPPLPPHQASAMRSSGSASSPLTDPPSLTSRSQSADTDLPMSPLFNHSPPSSSFHPSSPKQIPQQSSLTSSAAIELVQFILETESRALILSNVENVSAEALMHTCEKIGSLAYLRMDFRTCRGVVFLAYHDLRVAVHAYHTLSRELAGLCLGPAGGERGSPTVHYSIMLNAATTPRDGILLCRESGRAGIPMTLSDSDVQAVFSSYGQLRNAHRRVVSSSNGSASSTAFLIEYYDVQEAKHAAFELATSTPWGPGIMVEEAERSDKERQLGQHLLLTLHRWREEQRMNYMSQTVPAAESPQQDLHEAPHHYVGSPMTTNTAASLGSNLSPSQLLFFKHSTSYPGSASSTPTLMAHTPNGSTLFPLHSGRTSSAPSAAAYAHMLEGLPRSPLDSNDLSSSLKGLWATLPSLGSVKGRTASPNNMPYTTRRAVSFGTRIRDSAAGLGPPPAAVGGAGGSMPWGLGGGGMDLEYQLDLDKLLRGLDKRTTIMIRNIPNKYTQQLLLNEINVVHKGKYDFFYLPIDFKNKCNVGYAFINFIDYRAIVAFYKEFNGQRWKNFNSEKVCAISYARIQGKQSMISRFQNSSLMEKDGEYRPLLFFSNGLERGKAEPFPMGSKHNRRSSGGSTTPTTPTSFLLGVPGLGALGL